MITEQVRFEVHLAVSMKKTAFCGIALFGLIEAD